MDSRRQNDRRIDGKRRRSSANSQTSDASYQTIWPRLRDDGEFVLKVRPSMAPVTGYTSREITDWNLIPRPLTINKKRKNPTSAASAAESHRQRPSEAISRAPIVAFGLSRSGNSSSSPAGIQRRETPGGSIGSVNGLSEYIETRWPGQETRNFKWLHELGPYAESNPGDDDDFEEAFAQISVVDHEIRSNIEASHAEIQKRGTGDAQNESLDLQNILVPPPETPASPVRSPLGSPSHQRKRKNAQFLAEEAFEDLMERDMEFRKLMNDLEGIKQWWFENHEAWEKRRREISRKRETIAEFREQQLEEQQQRPRKKTIRGFIFPKNDANTSRDENGSEDDHWQEQIEIQEEDIMELRVWFIENKMLMKEVWRKFKILQTDAERLERLPLENDEPQPKYEFDWIWTSDYTSDELIQNRGLIWWFENARDHLVPWDAFLTERKEYWSQQKERYMELEKNYRERAEINFREYRETEIAYDRDVQTVRSRALRDRADEDEANASIQHILSARKLKHQEFEEQERLLQKIIVSFVAQDNANKFRYNDFSDRHWRVTTAVKIITGTIQALQMHGYPARQPDAAIISHIMKIAYWESHRQEYTTKLDSLLESEAALDNSNYSKVIIKRAKDHLEHHDFRHQVEPLIEATKSAFQPSSDAFPKLAQVWNLEYIPFVILVTNLSQQENLSQFEEPTQTVALSWQPPKLPPVPEIPAWPWRKKLSIQQAVRILNLQRSSQSYRAGYKIFRFFNSPDIFPLFLGQTSTSWTKPSFLKLICGLIKNEIKDDALDAFLTYCNHTGELFNISAILGKIYVSEHGWDRAPEARVSEIFERRLKFRSPRSTEKLERLLVANKHLFGLDGSDRNWRKRDLLQKINRFLPDGKLTIGGLNKYCGYWGAVGRFFVTTAESKKNRRPGDDPIDDFVIRVDNGWEIPKSEPWVAPTAEPLRFVQISRKVQENTDIRPACVRRKDQNGNSNIYTTEDKLYNLTYGVKSEQYHIDCSRNAFHMYLRWCDKKGDVFKFYRNADILVVGHLWWGSMAEVVTDESAEKPSKKRRWYEGK